MWTICTGVVRIKLFIIFFYLFCSSSATSFTFLFIILLYFCLILAGVRFFASFCSAVTTNLLLHPRNNSYNYHLSIVTKLFKLSFQPNQCFIVERKLRQSKKRLFFLSGTFISAFMFTSCCGVLQLFFFLEFGLILHNEIILSFVI